LKAGKISVNILNFGCVVKDILVPDRNGKVVDVCLAYDNFDGEVYSGLYLLIAHICSTVSNNLELLASQL
jgi:hypothetical protein